MIIPPEGAILNVFKPQGVTSFDVVRQVRRKLGVKKVGHGGTLDPVAEGVLIILVGKATKRSNELMALEKEYRAGILLGITSDTDDITGNLLNEKPVPDFDKSDIENALDDFRGEIEQVPPMYSALKVKGQRLYKLARKGIEIEREPRKVSVYDIGIEDWRNPHLVLTVRCSRGTYIRSLARDLGDKLGCGGTMESLVRTRIGDYRVEETLKLQDLEITAGNRMEKSLD